MVVLIDARDDGGPAGTVAVAVVSGDGGGGGSHAFGPTELVGLATELYGSAPPTVLVTITVGDADTGEELSREVHRAVPGAVAAVEEVLRRCGR